MWQQLQAEEQREGTSGQRSKAAAKRARKKAANQQAATADQSKQAAKRPEPAAAGPHKSHDQAAGSEQQLSPQPAATAVVPPAAAITAQSKFSIKQSVQSMGAAVATARTEWLRCPLSGSIMRDPVLYGSEGHSFERAALEQWLAANPGVDPLSRQPLPPESGGAVPPNHTLRNMIQQLHVAESA